MNIRTDIKPNDLYGYILATELICGECEEAVIPYNFDIGNPPRQFRAEIVNELMDWGWGWLDSDIICPDCIKKLQAEQEEQE